MVDPNVALSALGGSDLPPREREEAERLATLIADRLLQLGRAPTREDLIKVAFVALALERVTHAENMIRLLDTVGTVQALRDYFAALIKVWQLKISQLESEDSCQRTADPAER